MSSSDEEDRSLLDAIMQRQRGSMIPSTSDSPPSSPRQRPPSPSPIDASPASPATLSSPPAAEPVPPPAAAEPRGPRPPPPAAAADPQPTAQRGPRPPAAPPAVAVAPPPPAAAAPPLAAPPRAAAGRSSSKARAAPAPAGADRSSKPAVAPMLRAPNSFMSRLSVNLPTAEDAMARRRNSQIDWASPEMTQDLLERAKAYLERSSRLGDREMVLPLATALRTGLLDSAGATVSANTVESIRAGLTKTLARDDAPQCFAAEAHRLAVGAKSGVVLVFDSIASNGSGGGVPVFRPSQRLIPPTPAPCTSVALSPSVVVAGYASGEVVVWKLTDTSAPFHVVPAPNGAVAITSINMVVPLSTMAEEVSYVVVDARNQARLIDIRAGFFFGNSVVEVDWAPPSDKPCEVAVLPTHHAVPSHVLPITSRILAKAHEGHFDVVSLEGEPERPQVVTHFRVPARPSGGPRPPGSRGSSNPHAPPRARTSSAAAPDMTTICPPGAAVSLAWRPVLPPSLDPQVHRFPAPILAEGRGRRIRFFWVSHRSRNAPPGPLQPVPQLRRSPQSPLSIHLVVEHVLADLVAGFRWLAGGYLLVATRADISAPPDTIVVLDVSPEDGHARRVDEVPITALRLRLPVHAPRTAPISLRFGASMASPLSSPGSVFLLGSGGVSVLRAPDKLERVKSMIASPDQHQWMPALAMGLELFRARGGSRSDLNQDMVNLVLRVASQALALSALHADGDDGGSPREVVRVICAAAVEFCLAIGRHDVLLNHLHSIFVKANEQDLYFELLEPLLLNARVPVLTMPVLRALVKSYVQSDRVAVLEQVLCGLDPEAVQSDHGVYDKIVQTCRQQRFVLGLFHFTPTGSQHGGLAMPAAQVLRLALFDVPDEQRASLVGHQLLLKIVRLLEQPIELLAKLEQGSAEPTSMLVASARARLFALHMVFSRAPPPTFDGNDIVKAALPRGIVYDGDGDFMWLRYFLQLNARAFLDALSKSCAKDAQLREVAHGNVPAAGGPDSASSHSRSDSLSRRGPRPPPGRPFEEPVVAPRRPGQAAPPSARQLQRATSQSLAGPLPSVLRVDEMCDILLGLVSQPGTRDFSPAAKASHWDAEQVAAVYKFAAHLMAAEQLPFEAGRVQSVLECLMSDGFEARPNAAQEREERQNVLMTLIRAVPAELVDDQRLLARAGDSGLHKLRAFLFQRTGDYAQVLKSLMQEPPHLRGKVFDMLLSAQEDLSARGDGAIDGLHDAVLEYLPALVDTNAERTAELTDTLFYHFPDKLQQAADKLGSAELRSKRFAWLSALFRSQARSIVFPKDSGKAIAVSLRENYVRELCESDPDGVLPFVKNRRANNGMKGQETQWTFDLCQQHKVLDATAYLAKLLGNSEEALSLHVRVLESRIEAVRAHFERSQRRQMMLQLQQRGQQGGAGGAAGGGAGGGGRDLPRQRLATALSNAIDLCKVMSEEQRGAEDEEQGDHWFRLLEVFTHAQKKFKDAVADRSMAPHLFDVLSVELLANQRTLLQEIMGKVSLHHIMERLARENPDAEFRQFKDTIFGMMDASRYATQIQENANSVQVADVFAHFQRLRLQRSTGLRSSASSFRRCAICRLLFVDDDDAAGVVLVFRCGHSFHRVCLLSEVQDYEEPHCAICAADAAPRSFQPLRKHDSKVSLTFAEARDRPPEYYLERLNAVAFRNLNAASSRLSNFTFLSSDVGEAASAHRSHVTRVQSYVPVGQPKGRTMTAPRVKVDDPTL